MVKKILVKLRKGLTKTREGLVGKVGTVVRGRTKIDEEMLEQIEEILLQADIGVSMTTKIMDGIQRRIREGKIIDPEEILSLLKGEIMDILGSDRTDTRLTPPDSRPWVIVMVGVNGTGKTTTIGKLAYRYAQERKKVLLAASDTFRAAAIDQLEIWADRARVDIVRHQPRADPASVAFDALKASQARGVDILIIDTAGRLHTKVNLMEELKKIKRVLAKQMEGAPHEMLLVLDATTGQNGISQAKMFDEALELTGIVLAKLDGTAKGGVIVAIKDELDIPVRLIGIGQELEDLREFDPEEFVEALFD